MLSSLQTALHHLDPACPWLMVCLVDQPAIAPATFRIVASRANQDGWVTPTFRGRRGHPVVIGRHCFEALRTAAPEQNPREVLAPFPRTLVEVEDAGVTLDFDTPEEWRDYQVKGLRVQPPSPDP